MKRIKLADRLLPAYTKGEEILNSGSHAAGVGFGITVLVLCIVFSAKRHDYWAMAGGMVYGIMMIILYGISSIYHGLLPEGPKKVFQVLDHCSIYALIFGTYIPILFTGVREYNLKLFIGILIYVIAFTAIGVTFTAIDFKTYAPISMSCYFIVGWSALFVVVPLIRAFGWKFFIWLFIGGAAYTLGMIFFKKGITQRYYHSVFHFFILAGSALQFVGIFKYCIIRA